MQDSQQTEIKLFQAIRKNCLDCMGGQWSEVPLCTSPKCTLYPYRYGRLPQAGDLNYIGNMQYNKLIK